MRRRIIVWGIGILVLALIAPLVAGLLPSTTVDDVTTTRAGSATTELPPETSLARQTLTEPEFAGATITGDTPCPKTDGSQERVTTFESEPPMCIDTTAKYTMTLSGPTGAIKIDIKAASAPKAANLAVTLARYGVYDFAPTLQMVPGFVLIGALGDAGFETQASAGEAPFNGAYPVGSVIMFTTIEGVLQGQLGIITTETAANALAETGAPHPIIGSISEGLSEAEELTNLMNSRLDDVAVTETPEATPTSTSPPVDDPAPKEEVGQLPEGCPAEDGSSPRTLNFDGPHPMCINTNETYVATFDTTEGVIKVTLDTMNAPDTVNNFVTLARWGYYDATTIFRTEPNLDIIQGGSPNTETPGDPGPGYSILDEPPFVVDPETGSLKGPYRYEPGDLAMARTAEPNSAAAQYFFSTGPNTSVLNSQGTYVVFGQTDSDGLAVLESIIDLHEPNPNWDGNPSRTVTVNSVTIEVR